jgi:hypothetical protein
VGGSVVVYDGAVSRADVDVWESELKGLFARIGALFYRTESKRHAEQVRPRVVVAAGAEEWLDDRRACGRVGAEGVAAVFEPVTRGTRTRCWM